MIKKVLTFILPLLLTFLHPFTFAQSVKTLWVDSVFNTLNVSEKVGHLFLVPVETNTDAESIHSIEELIKSHEIGGIILQEGSVLPPQTLITSFHKTSDVPLFIGYSGQVELVLDSNLVFPEPEILGAVNNDTLMFRYGAQLGKQLRADGINLVFTRTNVAGAALPEGLDANELLGEDKLRITNKSLALMQGLQANSITTCAQYFTLSKLTVIDAKKEPPVFDLTIDPVQSFPFQALINHGIKGIMPGGSKIPIEYRDKNSLNNDYTDEMLTTFFTSAWIKEKMQYEGLSFVNTEKIKGNDKDSDGEVELLAFKAGNDILITKDIAQAIRKIKRLVRKDANYMEQLDQSVKKILAAKFDANLWQGEYFTPIQNPHQTRIETQLVNQKLYEEAVTVIRNDHQAIPQRILENKNYAYINTHPTLDNRVFFEYLTHYVSLASNTIEDQKDEADLVRQLQKNQVILIGVFPETSDKTLARLNRVLDKLNHNPEVIICDFGNKFLSDLIQRYPHVITAYHANRHGFQAVPQVLFGALPAKGRLPYSLTNIKAGTGIQTEALGRLTYSLPEGAGMDSRVLQRIDSIVKEAINIGATPGCQVFVARNGKVIYEKNFGYLTYDKKSPVTKETIYDLASITKVAATLQTAMFMHEHGLIDLHKKVSHYLPDLKKTNKKDITVIDMLTHQSGLLPFIPMYPATIKDTVFLPLYYNRIQTEKYPLQVADKLFASPNIKDSVWTWILKTDLNPKPVRTPFAYKYSDLGFLILQRMAEKILNQPMNEFMYQNFYEPLGAYTMGFTPLNRFNKQRIAPTEDDKIFRRTSVAGTVHDERAAMLGGIAGHAGLFGTASDLGKLCQMLLQEGWYGGYRYFKPETVKLFTTQTYRTSRRGIGWDKPLQSEWNSPTSMYASPLTFGHTGFTGTAMWVDPEFDLVYVFLSNRVYPDRNAKLINANIRSRIQDTIYKSIFAFQEKERPKYIVSDFATIKGNENRPLK